MKKKEYMILIIMVICASLVFASERSGTSLQERLQRHLFGASTLEGVKSVYQQVMLEVLEKGAKEPSLLPRIGPLSRKDLRKQVDEFLRKSRIEIADLKIMSSK